MPTAATIAAELQSGQGYAVIAEILSPAEVSHLREQLTSLAADEKAKGKLIEHNRRWRLRLVGHGDMLFDLAQLPLIRDTAEAMLGPDYVLGGLSAHALTPGAPPQGIHVDYPSSVIPEPFPETPMQMRRSSHWTSSGKTMAPPASSRTARRRDDAPTDSNSTSSPFPCCARPGP